MQKAIGLLWRDQLSTNLISTRLPEFWGLVSSTTFRNNSKFTLGRLAHALNEAVITEGYSACQLTDRNLIRCGVILTWALL